MKDTKKSHNDMAALHITLSILAIATIIQAARMCPDAINAHSSRIHAQEDKAVAIAETACGYGLAFLAANWESRNNPDLFNFSPPEPFAVEANGGLTIYDPENESIVIKIEPISDDNAVVCAVVNCHDSTAVVVVELLEGSRQFNQKRRFAML